ncbi:CHAD domain-containing protein [Acidisoma cellulosilytica]|uniref:CHAD domain-containing protein n=1 Tax=Acidisoma cellulosilyticum TaxID=2802395 RepID=A0A964E242_9PROT|nr:CHAD domain-containing protein [Acidisoma cellulosilyticum]MCB8879016.1 CHAD domain-containing protein [Acidisoma cellulosilyticum]
MPDTTAVITAPVVMLELVCAPTALTKLTRHPALRTAKVRRPRARPFTLTWYDTASYALAGRDLALADCDAEQLWELKRLGLGWPRRPGMAAASIATAVNPAGLEEAGYAIPGPLQKTASLTGERQRFPVTRDGVVLDCTLITGEAQPITPQGASGASRLVVRLTISGPLTKALDLAQALAADLPILPAFMTLPQEMLLLRGAKLKALPAPALSAEMTTTEAFAIIASGFVQTFLTRLEQIEGRSGPEPVHQARVTLRRLRALMLAFRPILGDAEDRLKPLLGRLKTVLGPARDWDVFLSETVDPLARALPEADPAIDWLRSAATARREAAYAALIDWLRRPDYRSLVWRLVDLCLGSAEPALLVAIDQPPAAEADAALAGETSSPIVIPASTDDLIGSFAQHCLESRWKKTIRPVRELIPMPLPELHELRIKCKKLRYQAEMLQDALPAKSGRKLIKRLTETQEIMGLLNDGAVATELAVSLRPGQDMALREQVLAAEAIGVIHGYSIGHTRDGRAAVIESWRKLARFAPF